MVLAGLLVTASLAGCGTASAGAQGRRAELARLEYPKDAPFGQDMDVLILPASQSITVVNRTAQPLGAVQLWLNQQYVGVVDGLAVGAKKQMSLADFINAHGESFPTAGFLAPDRALRLVHTEIFNPQTGRRHRAIVMLAD